MDCMERGIDTQRLFPNLLVNEDQVISREVNGEVIFGISKGSGQSMGLGQGRGSVTVDRHNQGLFLEFQALERRWRRLFGE